MKSLRGEKEVSIAISGERAFQAEAEQRKYTHTCDVDVLCVIWKSKEAGWLEQE